ncbi:hypothetical protein ONZ45_g18807 [Pleurotus djamor]|nr:hypothetical protein ONZ45_g18807 [Pleurotus djamor]
MPERNASTDENASNLTVTDIPALVLACEPAPFGRNNENVLDDDYRKAGKLDVTNFSLNFDLSSTGILEKIKKELLADDRKIRADLYKLNLYGVGSFFKSHQDTPRDESMFGSLVLVLPTPHEGGELILRPKGLSEVRYDSSAILRKQNTPAIIYTAFYSEIEHEVLPVTAGHRVTLTYNLYFHKSHDVVPSAPLTSPINHPFAIALLRALRSPQFLPNGGTLGYGLRNAYPVSDDSWDISPVMNNLKGKDATVAKLCRLLNLRAIIKVVYEVDSQDPVRYVALDDIPTDIDGAAVYDDDGESIFDMLRAHSNSMVLSWGDNNDDPVEPDSDEGEDSDHESSENGGDVTNVLWITEPNFNGGLKISYATYGNEASMSWNYGSFCFLIPVDSYEERMRQLIPILKKFSAM